MIKCRYCKKLIDARDCIAFCNEDCVSNYVIVKILEAKQELAKG
jgi:hypothetical protein